MRRDLQEKAKEYIKTDRIRMKFRIVLSLLSAIVAFTTLYVLVSPAITLEDIYTAVSEVGLHETIEGAIDVIKSASASESQMEKGTEPETSTDVTENLAVSEEKTTTETASSGNEHRQGASTQSAAPAAETDTSQIVVSSRGDGASAETSDSDAGESATQTETAIPVQAEETHALGINKTVYRYENDDIKATVVFSNPASVSDDAILSVVRLDESGDDDGIELYNRYNQLLNDDAGISDESGFTAYRFNFTLNGQSVVPASDTVTVTIEDASFFTDDVQDIRIFRPVEADDEIQGVQIVAPDEAQLDNQMCSFVASGIPDTYLVVDVGSDQATDDDRNYVYENDGLKVTATLSSSTIIPSGATLFATRITKTIDPVRYRQLSDLIEKSVDVSENIPFYAYDICFLLDGQEIEPLGDGVNVTITDQSGIMDVIKNVQVFHVLDSDGKASSLQEVDAQMSSAEGDQLVAFTADSFSPYIVLPNGSSLTFKLISTQADTFVNTSYYDPNRLLGMAGNFHAVAFGTMTLNTHTNGNILANNLVANSNFGTNNLTNELSYVQNYTKVIGNSASKTTHTLVIGSTNTVTLVDNGNAFAINGTKLDSPKNLWQDDNTATLPFIDLNYVKSQVTSISSTLGAMGNANITSNLSASAGSCDSSYITLTGPTKVGVYNITASALSTYSYFGVKGFGTGQNGTVIINVDCTGRSTPIQLPTCEIYIAGVKQTFKEVTTFTTGKVIWNFINCTATVNTYLLYSTILAPNATLNIGQNLNGTIVGNNVSINAESHRDDFTGKFTDSVIVTKSWLGKNNEPLGSAALTDMSVTVQLYRGSGSTKVAVGSPVTLSNSTGWSYTWTGLAGGYYYTAEETGVYKNGVDVMSKYTVTYSTTTGITSGVMYVYNKFIYALPNTGGVGNYPFLIIGCALMGTVLYISLRKQKLRRKKEINQLE